MSERLIRRSCHDAAALGILCQAGNTRYAGYRIDLSRSNLREISISDLLRSKKILSGSLFIDCNAQDVNLCRCLLRCTIFFRGSFDGADFSDTEMQGAWLADIPLNGAKFNNSCLYEAYFYGAKLNSHTSFKGAQLDGAALRLVDFTAVKLTQEQVSSAFGDASVILPNGIARPSHWPDWKLPDNGKNEYNKQRKKWLDDPEGYIPPPKPD